MSQRKIQPVTSIPDDLGGVEGRREQHPAFAVAVVNRGSGTGRALFQSDLLHNQTVSMSIHEADRNRALNSDWVHPGKLLVEIEMSEAQWGALVSSMGIGSGVPVTLRARETDYRVSELPHEPRMQESLKEVEEAANRLIQEAMQTGQALQRAIEGKEGVKAVREALSRHQASLRNLPSNATFAVKSLQDASEKVVNAARADIEAHILNTQRAVGDAPIEAPRIDLPTIEG